MAKAVRAKPQEQDEGEDEDGGEAGRSRHFINGLAKGLAIIQAFNDEAHALTLAEAAARTGLTRAAARRILMTLEDLGFAARHGERHFVLTPKVLSLGYAYLSSMPLWAFAEPVLENLVEELGETCGIAVLDGTELVYVLRIPVHRILSQGVTIGSRLPLHCHSSGRVLLSGLNATQLDAYFAHAKLKPYTPRTITDEAKLRRLVADAAQKGHAWVSGELEQHISGLSVPIFQPDGSVLAAMNVSLNRESVSEASIVKQMLPRLRRAAERLNSSLVMAGAPKSRVVRMGRAQRLRRTT
ncbi:IclR family transcriptional regulator domain-containing protein [Ramlibacter humi]|uniref:IclR family transcriptional regulator n=1 Tax=Ramlibacter humi TaxID=2530451 RepID=A0A4Z0BE57_9BURK|nr:IclR family transcriptional regulator C-terminal domain-containing protein [Ramlibacter humi]TFY96607.1 IclR family transcriptional regulator [Ramlibacter humi]